MNVYDFDNTIYAGDSSVDLYFYCLRHAPQVLLALPKQALAGLRYLPQKHSPQAETAKTAFKQEVYSYFRRVPDLPTLVERFWDTHLDRIKPWYLSRQQADDVVISASPEFLIGPACARLGIDCQLSSRVEAATGHYQGLNCHGEEKVRRFRARFGAAEIDEFFSDSLSDTPLARLAKQAWLVKGDALTPWPEIK